MEETRWRTPYGGHHTEETSHALRTLDLYDFIISGTSALLAKYRALFKTKTRGHFQCTMALPDLYCDDRNYLNRSLLYSKTLKDFLAGWLTFWLVGCHNFANFLRNTMFLSKNYYGRS